MTTATCKTNLPNVLGEIIETAIALTDANFGNIQLLDPDGSLKIVAYRGFPDWWIEYWNTVTAGHGACGSPLALGERVVVEDVEQNPIFAGTSAMDIHRKAGVRAVQSTPIRGRSGQVLGMLSTHCRKTYRPGTKALKVLDLLATHAATLIERDQSDQAASQPEARLHGKEEHLRLLIKYAPAAFAMFDQDMCYLAASNRWRKDYFLGDREIIGHSLYEIFPEIGEDWKAVHRRALAGETVRAEEDRFVRADGKVHWLRWEALPWRTPSDEVGGIVILSEDITERIKAEEELRESEAKYRTIVENGAQGIAISSPDGIMTSVNKAMANMLGYDVEEMLGRPSMDFFFPDWEHRVYEATEKVCERGVFEGEFELKRKDGSPLCTCYTAVRLLDKQGEHIANVGLHIDITERKRAEKNLDILADISQFLTKATCEREIIPASARKIGEYFQVAHCIFAEFGSQAETMRVIYDWRSDPTARSLTGSYRMEVFGEPGLYAALTKGLPVVTNDVEREEHANVKVFQEHNVASGINAPFVRKGVLKAAIIINQPVRRQWRKDEISLLQELTRLIWVRIEQCCAEEALHESEEQLRALVKASSDVVYRMSADWREMRHLVGRDFIADSLEPDQTWLDKYIPPDDQKHVMAVIKKALRAKCVFELEHKVIRKDGSLGWTFSRAIPIFDANGKIVEWLGMASDVTARKKAVEAMLESEKRYRLLLQSIDAAVVVHDRHTIITMINQSALNLLGITKDQAIGRAAFDPEWMFLNEDGTAMPRSLYPVNQVISSRKALKNFTIGVNRPLTGDIAWLIVSATPVFNDSELQEIIVSFMDITERKNQEENQKYSQLMQAMARQQVAVQTAAAFAHELNQPLLSIVAYNEVALKALSNNKEMKTGHLDRAILGSYEQALRAGRVLHELMDHLHKDEIEPTPFYLNALVRGVVDKIRAVEFSKIEAVFNLESDLPSVLGNRLQTEKVLGNLIHNGIEAMEEAGVSPASFAIEVRTHAGYNMAHVTVRDSGPGLNAEAARRIFDPFFTTKSNGLGLGLAISRSLIEAQGGQLWLDPEAGPGATFHFTLPFAHD